MFLTICNIIIVVDYNMNHQLLYEVLMIMGTIMIQLLGRYQRLGLSYMESFHD